MRRLRGHWMIRGESKTVKRIWAILAIAAFALFCAMPASPAFAESSGETLTVGVPTDRPPIFYQDAGTGEVTGIGVGLMRAAAQEAGFTVTFESIGTDLPREAIDDGSYDIVMPFASDSGSASGHAIVLSDVLIDMPFTLVTLGNWNPLPQESFKVGTQRTLSATAELVKQLYPGIEIIVYDSLEECVSALRAGEVDALLHNSYGWSYELQKPSYSDLKIQPSTLFSMGFRAGALDTPEGRAIIERLDGGIAQLDDTQRQSIALEHTTKQLYRYDLFDYLYQYWLAIILAALLVVALIIIIVLRRRAAQFEQEEKMRQLVEHDPLTGALSLAGFRKRVEEVLRANPDVPYVLSYNNIKNFKYINDSLGWESGDELLCFWVDKSLKSFASDEVMARLEGDHFAVLRRVEGEERMLQDEENVLDPVRNYFVNQGKETRVQVCSGVYVLTPTDYQEIDVDHMLDCARVAEKRLRETRKDGYEFYNPEQWEKGRLSAEITSRLPLAIQSGEIEVWYQPQVNFATGKITGLEALCRWNHGKLGWLLPPEFIPVLEESGLIYELDRFVWEQACKDLARWTAQGKHLPVSVNLARNDILEDRNIPGYFYDLVQTWGLTPDQLRIEITETAFVKDPTLLIGTTVKLRELGFTVEMDDFGSGYSSLHMLKEVPVDRIKMDLHFLSGTGDAEKGRIIVSQVISLVNQLGMDLIAEGVEFVDQALFLQEQGCSEMQGFYFYKPMSAEDFENLNPHAEA